MANTCLLIGLDGATFSVLDPLIKQGRMPFFASCIEGGARADLMSTIPALTPPAWTSLATGVNPGAHGILDFFQKDSAASPHIRLATHRDILAETIWSIVSRHGGSVTTLNFPVMLPPPKIHGHVMGGWVPWKQLRSASYPPGLFDEVKALPGVNVREAAMDMALEEKAIEGCRPEESVEWIDLHIRREENWHRIARHLMETAPAALTAVLFDGVDKIQHMCWRVIDPEVEVGRLSALERDIRDRCLQYFARIDELIADLVERAGPDAMVFIASDHGFGPQRETFFVNAWLAERGYLAWAADTPPTEEAFAVLGVGQMARHVYLMDWAKTKAYVATPSGNGIHIVPQSDEYPGGVPAGEYDAFRDRLVEELEAIPSSVADGPLVAKAWTREEAFSGPAAAKAPDLTLVLCDGGLVSILDADRPVKPRPEPVGTHAAEGILVARGPGVAPGASLGPVSIMDVAPSLLHGMDLPVPVSMEGTVIEALFTSSRPVRHEESAPPAAGADASGGEALDAEAEAEVTARLKALGYL